MTSSLKRRKLSSSSYQNIVLPQKSTAPSERDSHHTHDMDSTPSPSPHASVWAESGRQHEQLPKDGHGLPSEQAKQLKFILPRQDSVSSPTLPFIPSPTLTPWTPPTNSPTLTSVKITSASIPADTIPAGVTPSESLTLPLSSTSMTASRNNSSTSLTSSLAAQSSTTSDSRLVTNSTISSVTSSLMSNTRISSNNTITKTTTTHPVPLFFATLSDGHTVTVSRYTTAYTTTLRDGEAVTVPAISATRGLVQTPATFSSQGPQVTVASDPGTGTPVSSAPATTTTAAGSDHNSNNTAPPAGAIAGGVVGGAAGLAVVLLIAMLFVRWYRRKASTQHRALPPGAGDLPDHDPPIGPSGPGMAERAGLMPLMSAVPGFFRHQNRSLGDTSEPSERGFTRVSGRKLPSAFSEGMSSEVVARPEQQLNAAWPPSNVDTLWTPNNMASIHPGGDTNGYPGTNVPASPTSQTSSALRSSSGTVRNSDYETMIMLAGPQRLPQVHHGGPYTVAPSADLLTSSPPPETSPFEGYDNPSHLRNSRFTEDM